MLLPIAFNINIFVANSSAGGIYAMPQLLDRYGLGVPIGPGTMVWAKRYNLIVYNLCHDNTFHLKKKTNLRFFLILLDEESFIKLCIIFFILTASILKTRYFSQCHCLHWPYKAAFNFCTVKGINFACIYKVMHTCIFHLQSWV